VKEIAQPSCRATHTVKNMPVPDVIQGNKTWV